MCEIQKYCRNLSTKRDSSIYATGFRRWIIGLRRINNADYMIGMAVNSPRAHVASRIIVLLLCHFWGAPRRCPKIGQSADVRNQQINTDTLVPCGFQRYKRMGPSIGF